jgi:hypothetical protein
MPSCKETAAAFEEGTSKESRLLVAANCGGGAVTVNDTTMVWRLPAQGLGATQDTLMVAWYGLPAAASETAEGASAIPTLPGVVPPPVTSSHDACGETVNE